MGRWGANTVSRMHIRRDWIGAVRAYATGHFVVVYGQRERVRVYYCSTYYKAVRVGRGDSGGHVLRETTSRGLCGLVCPSRTSERGGKGDRVKGGGEEGERERERVLGGATTPQPSMVRLIRNAAAFAAASPTLLFKPW